MKERRNLDGIYFRVQRDDKWQDICFSDLTEAEMYDIMDSKPEGWLKKMCVILANTLYGVGKELDLHRK